jgi:tRNA(Arg) A34 adenosine deaminase TadA
MAQTGVRTESTAPKKHPRQKDALSQDRVWLKQAMALAASPAEKAGSPHPSVKVGAILVDTKGKEIARDVNRFASGIDRRRPERYENAVRSLWINCAEQMVLIKAVMKGAKTKGSTLYVTLEPCAVCAGLLVECGVKEVVVPLSSRRSYAKLKAKWKKSIEIGTSKLTEAGIKIRAIDMNDTQG